MEVIPKNPMLEYLPDTLVSIRKIYNLENGRMDQSVDILDQWIKKQTHFANTHFCREYLERCIITCKGSVEKAKTQIDKLCTFKTLMPKFFECSDIKETLLRVNEVGFPIPLPKMTEDYQRVFYAKLGNVESTTATYFEYCKITLVIAEYIKHHDYNNGFVVIEDFRDINIMELLAKINFVEFQQFLAILMEGFGARVKGIHIITRSKIIDMFVNSVKPLISEKLRNRIFIHPNLEDLYPVIDKDLLPSDIGGKERPLKELQDLWLEELGSSANEKHLELVKAFNTNESLRQTGSFNEKYMGLPGSFRTLTVD